MGRKKLTHILLAAGSRTTFRNHQNETPLDIAVRKGFGEIIEVFRNPPSVVTPMQRDEIRASKFKSASSGPSSPGDHSKGKNAKDSRDGHNGTRRSDGGSNGYRRREKANKENGDSKRSNGSKRSHSIEVAPNWSPYGCHYHPNPDAFPPPKIDSLPNEPLRSGELYYLDLAGNIHKV